MDILLGIDLGTSSIKAMLLDPERGVIATAAAGHDVEIPQEGYAEQTPEIWWSGLKQSLAELKGMYPEEFGRIAGIGFSGQMHGVVTVDSAGDVIRPAILWLDQRSRKQLEEIGDVIDSRTLGGTICNRVFTGFAFPSLLWMRESEPDKFSRIRAILSPKDYIRFRITGEIGAEVSDASATAIFAVPQRDWAWDVIDRFGLPRGIFPKCHESAEIAGYVTADCSAELGLPEGARVVYGCGDQMAQSIGNGVCSEGEIISNIGTGGQIAAYSRRPVYDPELRTHTFCHAIPDAYTIYGAALASGLSQKWLKCNILEGHSYDELGEMASQVPAGSEGLLYLPYLSGERTPHMDPEAKGMFFGLTLAQDRRHMARAVLEGVTYSLMDSLTILEDLGVSGGTIIASGGGAKGREWLQIQADIFGHPVKVCRVDEQALLGACIVAGVGTGVFSSVREAVDRFVRFDSKIYYPDPENAGVYRRQYAKFRELYRATKTLMHG